MEDKLFKRNAFRGVSKIVKGTLKVGAVVIVGVVVYNKLSDKKVYANWTTNPPEPDPRQRWNTNWDRREPASIVRPPKKKGETDLVEYEQKLKNCTPTASRHILLIRHGQYFDNATNDKERFLTSLGRAQADLTGQRLKQLDLPYSALISSTMTRALETAKLVHKHVPELTHITDDSLREGAPIPPEPPIGSWRPEPKFFQDGARIESAFRKYFHRADPVQKEDSYEIIVCHANVIRYFICRALQFPGEGWLRLCVANCSLSLITIQPDGLVVLEMMGDHGHVPPQQITFG